MDANQLAERSLTNAADRLDERFPDVPRARIDEMIEEATHHFDGARITDHIPNLVEHEVRDRLRAARS